MFCRGSSCQLSVSGGYFPAGLRMPGQEVPATDSQKQALLRNCPSEHSYPFPQTIQDTRIVCGVPSRVN